MQAMILENILLLQKKKKTVLLWEMMQVLIFSWGICVDFVKFLFFPAEGKALPCGMCYVKHYLHFCEAHQLQETGEPIQTLIISLFHHGKL